MARADVIGVVFDLDGTLVDSAPAIRDIVNRLMDELALPPLDTAEIHSYIGNGAPVLLERTLTARAAFDREHFPALLARFQVLYAEAPGEANQPYPGVEVALGRLAAAGHPLAICTNKPAAPTATVLAALGWDRRFGTVIAGDTLPERKPHPAPLLEAARRLSSRAIAYVGDSEVDAATAVAAKVPFLLFTAGYRKSPVGALPHAAAFSDYAELPELVGRLAAG